MRHANGAHGPCAWWVRITYMVHWHHVHEQWGQFDVCPGSVRGKLDVTLESILGQFGVPLVHGRFEAPWVSPGSIWDEFGVTLGPWSVGSHFGVSQGLVWVT